MGDNSANGAREAEREDARRHPRFVVDNMAVTINGRRYAIIDISTRSVRLDHRGDAFPDDMQPTLIFQSEEAGRPDGPTYAAEGVFIRKDQFSVVFEFSAPCADWDAVLAAHKSFIADTLDANLWDR